MIPMLYVLGVLNIFNLILCFFMYRKNRKMTLKEIFAKMLLKLKVNFNFELCPNMIYGRLFYKKNKHI